MLQSASSVLSASGYASRRRDLLAVINQLNSLGVREELDLPRIVIIGNQSAGKSSVVEAISGITLPRDAGTCTRAPIECRLKSSPEPWSCEISIRKEYNSSGKQLNKGKNLNVKFGKILQKKEEVEPALRRAQFAVLNPDVDHKKILATRVEDLHTLTTRQMDFSRDVICVELKGPELTDLSFIDLPGIIQNAADETVSLVESMVMSYIKGNCLILVALPMTDDIENQKALTLARRVDEKGLRTIGVLTKPDMLNDGSIQALQLYLDVIEGRRHPLTHGYYVTRQLNDAQRAQNLSNEAAREIEEAFFKNTSPWSQSKASDRFGTKNLSNALSKLLVDVINTSLPGIKATAEERLTACREELSQLPPLIEEDPATYILNEIIAFSGGFQQYVQGGSASSAYLIQTHKDVYSKFKIAIRKTAPNFVPYTDKESSGRWDGTLDHEDEADNSEVDADDQDSEDSSDDDDDSREDEDESDARQGEKKKEVNQQKPFNLTAMKKYIKRSMTRELPNNVPFEAKVSLIKEFQTTWHKTAMQDCYKTIYDLTVELVVRLMEERFKRHPLLLEGLKVHLAELFTHHSQRCSMFLEAALEMEQTPATQNTHYLQTSKEKWLAKYKAARPNGSTAKAPAFETFSFSKPPTSTLAPDPAKRTSPKPSIAGVPASSSSSPTTGLNPKADPFLARAPATSNGTESTGKFAPPTSFKTLFDTNPTSPTATLPFSFNPSTTQTSKAAPASNSFAPPSSSTSLFPAITHSKPQDPESVNELLAMLAKLGYHGVTMDDLAKLKPGDEYETEIEVMAEVRGYFQVAYKRIIDTIPGLIDLRFLKAVGKEMQPFLVKKLGLGTADANNTSAALIAEPKLIVDRRNELMARRMRLENVQNELNKFHHL